MGNNLGFREVTGFTQTGLKILNDTLRVLWGKMLGNVEYKDLGSSAKRVIDGKLSTSVFEQSEAEIRLAI